MIYQELFTANEARYEQKNSSIRSSITLSKQGTSTTVKPSLMLDGSQDTMMILKIRVLLLFLSLYEMNVALFIRCACFV